MTTDIQEKQRVVAEFMGDHPTNFADFILYRNQIVAEYPNYHDDWKQQIPVWAKLCKKYSPTIEQQDSYYSCVGYDNPALAFEIIYNIIKSIQK